jgi:CRISPR-associated protein Cas2
MGDRVEKIVAPEEDSVRIYTVCAACYRIIKIIGAGEVSMDQDVYIV